MANEKRLIDANKIPYNKSGFPKGDDFDSGLDWAFREDIDKMPTVDAVEVVYCKDCIHSKNCKTRFFLEGYHRIKNPFCAAGERREGE